MNSNNFHENDIGEKRTYSSIDGKNESALLGEYNVVADECILVLLYIIQRCRNKYIINTNENIQYKY